MTKSKSIFTETFCEHVCTGDYIETEHNGFTLRATVQEDDRQEPPWRQEDGHGPVTERASGPREGERLLHRGFAIGVSVYYDYDSALLQARKEGWGVKGGRKDGESAEDYAARAVEADYEALRAWCNDEWRYYGVVVTVHKEGIQLGSASLWGIAGNHRQGDNYYFTEVANELVEEALDEAQTKLRRLCACAS